VVKNWLNYEQLPIECITGVKNCNDDKMKKTLVIDGAFSHSLFLVSMVS
jgi:hypothetical protein